MLNTNLNQFTVVENLNMFAPSAIEFLLETELNTYEELQTEVINSKVMSKEDIEKASDTYQEVIINILDTPNFICKEAQKNIRWKKERGWDKFEEYIEELGIW